MNIQLPDGSIREVPENATVADVAASIGKRLAKDALAGKIDGLVVQNPFAMGEKGVAALVAKSKGQAVEKRIDTGATMVTRENMQGPEVSALLSPDLAKYLQ